ncbi:UDP-2,4-diacetamido-2,4,6-trideoxy-beta-L-altropyranose hydrolase [Pseudoalteromonas piscicida]|uniref:UDP-2,4-diacetamido-2,4, 6-trideoxy-beta-L-altropyranose hydrolase n=1 Tax=Pseudoalteromonas piscicida TaxID=43662 RepID=A0A2A5JVM4_PSEO7|nr:UDP-2,4-diacetamido-2,4,6-trideoxy-beta-L-altropyranose hydrolase [Pseudoalteromonas piscicida]PCK33396.1 UDP-2,4-diacetamido-2,4,6-trideoxy-beta-L-altropyranose hydrolase [Pseudoalteromonas piscicida]
MIAIRVDTLCGLGHFMRCKWLALALHEYGKEVVFLVDKAVPEHLSLECMNEIKILPYAQTHKEDAHNTLKALSEIQKQVESVIVDSYRFDSEWEVEVAKQIPSIIVVDDLERAHSAKLLIDSKWCGDKTGERYASLDNKLLGPDFAMLSPEYHDCSRRKREQNRVMFSLGGGGDWCIAADLIALLLSTAPEVEVDVIIGPMAEGVESLTQLANTTCRLQLVQQPATLAPYYQSCSLFVGALGTSLYELAATNTPALTFSIAPNQANQQGALDDLGHYFHVPDLLTRKASEVVALILTLVKQSKRIIKARETAPIKVDGRGAIRVAEMILANDIKSSVTQRTLHSQQTNIWQLTESVQIRQCNDSDINRYLAARNLPNNTWRMTITSDIDVLAHYQWWFSNSRESFVMEANGKPLLYVWHQIYNIESQDYLIGGWFAASGEVNFAHAQMVLEWQLGETAAKYPKAIWLAVINKENKFVNLLNQRAGFVSIEQDEKKMRATQQLFPKASLTEFNYVGKEVNT